MWNANNFSRNNSNNNNNGKNKNNEGKKQKKILAPHKIQNCVYVPVPERERVCVNMYECRSFILAYCANNLAETK